MQVRRDDTMLWRTAGRYDPAHPPVLEALLSAPAR
jgi:hypothetical protein